MNDRAGAPPTFVRVHHFSPTVTDVEATRTGGMSSSRNSGEVMLWLQIVPPLDHGTAWIDVVATGRFAEVRARLPLSWK